MKALLQQSGILRVPNLESVTLLPPAVKAVIYAERERIESAFLRKEVRSGTVLDRVAENPRRKRPSCIRIKRDG